MTTQIAVKLPDDTVRSIDDLIASGRFRSRSDAVRAGLRLVLRADAREAVDVAFAEGFARQPDRPDEMDDARRLAIDAIEDEPWDRWW